MFCSRTSSKSSLNSKSSSHLNKICSLYRMLQKNSNPFITCKRHLNRLQVVPRTSRQDLKEHYPQSVLIQLCNDYYFGILVIMVFWTSITAFITRIESLILRYCIDSLMLCKLNFLLNPWKKIEHTVTLQQTYFGTMSLLSLKS